MMLIHIHAHVCITYTHTHTHTDTHTHTHTHASTYLHRWIVEFKPVLSKVEHERSAEEEMLVTEAGCDAAEVEEVGVLACACAHIHV